MRRERDVSQDQRAAVRGERIVALGGVGKDSHSVGLHVLRDALRRSGYKVTFLSTQNSVEELCLAAQHADAILVSNMDGHASHYLEALPSVMTSVGGRSALWYLGGNPSLDSSEARRAEFLELGFDRVLLEYVSTDAVIDMLDADLADRSSNRAVAPADTDREMAHASPQEPPALLQQRASVLAQWPTGAGAVDLVQSAAALAEARWLSDAQVNARQSARPLLQPRCGVDDVEAQRALFRDLEAGGADVLSFQIDSLTRNNCHAEVALILDAPRDGSEGPRLNGFPAVNHGAAVIRDILAEFPSMPFQVRHSTRDPRLLAEISFAGGVAAFEGGGLCYNLPYYPDYPPAESVRRWRYVDELAGYFARAHGVRIDREFFGVLTATLVPPSLAISVCILEALAAASRGVMSVSLGYAEQGHRWQDVAAIRCAERLGRDYLDRYGYSGVQVSTVFHQFMGAFPLDADAARTLIWNSGVTAALSGATRIMLKTGAEANRIPSASDNCESLRLVASACDAAAQAPLDQVAVDRECALIAEEVRAILDASLDAGRDDPDSAMVEAVARGFIDVPFSPSRWNRNEVRCLRDETGAVRIAKAGRMSLSTSTHEANTQLVATRLKRDGQWLEEAIEADVTALIGIRQPRWPLGGDTVATPSRDARAASARRSIQWAAT
jgi:methylaspartate mutase epsilon subunit